MKLPEQVQHRHREAFCLMQYRDAVTGEIELLWNSRDGVTPFVITSRAGNEAQHVNWQKDRRVPDFRPTPGMRIFVDASPKHAHIREAARDYVEKYWDSGAPPMRDVFDGFTKDQAVEHFIADWTMPGSPTVIEAEHG